MPLKYLSPLLLAGSATAFEFYGLGLKALAANNAVNAAASTDAGYKACNSVSSVVMSCSAAGSIAESVPEASQAACVCCQGNSELDPVYSNCAAYVSTALQNPSLASGMTNPSLLMGLQKKKRFCILTPFSLSIRSRIYRLRQLRVRSCSRAINN